MYLTKGRRKATVRNSRGSARAVRRIATTNKTKEQLTAQEELS